jgi:hypothetical protein
MPAPLDPAAGDLALIAAVSDAGALARGVPIVAQGCRFESWGANFHTQALAGLMTASHLELHLLFTVADSLAAATA